MVVCLVCLHVAKYMEAIVNWFMACVWVFLFPCLGLGHLVPLEGSITANQYKVLLT